jgi:hypothetical protein
VKLLFKDIATTWNKRHVGKKAEKKIVHIEKVIYKNDGIVILMTASTMKGQSL